MPDHKNLLLISYFFPPLGGSGSLRTLKLAKYMASSGWLPYILTVKNPDWYYAIDPGLLDELPGDTPIFRSRMIKSRWIYWALNPFRTKKMDKWIRQWMMHPDPQIGWVPSAVRYGIKIIKRFNIRAIYSTSAPLSSHLIACLIKKKTGIPWIAHFRDEWFENPDNYYPTRWHQKIHFHLEKTVVKTADHVVAAAPGFCDLLLKHHPPKERLSTLTMGFDPEDFKESMRPLPAERKKHGQLIITFSGLFYGSFRPTIFLKMVNSLIDEGKIPKDRIRIKFVGANTPDDSHFNDVYGICSFTGFMSHLESVHQMCQSDVQLLLLSKERGRSVIPSKTFEYMASGKPILALVPSDGEVASIIRKTKTGYVIDFEDVNSLRKTLLELYRQWECGEITHNPDWREIENFNQKRIASALAELLNHYCGINSSGVQLG